MVSSSKFQCMFLLFCVSCLSVISVSLGDETEFSVSPISPMDFLPTTLADDQAVTCPVPQDKCASECDRRCSATMYKNNCLLFCNKCCNKCLCVPPGTLGNKECCPCYNNWKTKEGGPKCP